LTDGIPKLLSKDTVRDIIVLLLLGAKCNIIVYKELGTEYYLPYISANRNDCWLQAVYILLMDTVVERQLSGESLISLAKIFFECGLLGGDMSFTFW